MVDDASPPADEERSGKGRPYWARLVDEHGKWRNEPPPGADLAALRQGIGREPGSVPAMWPFYTTLSPDGRITTALRAEHLALTLFSVHQQSRPEPMHRRRVGVGSGVLALKTDPRSTYSADAVDRRFNAAATATDLTEMAVHLRGLVTQLRGLGQPLDYDWLVADLRGWQSPDRVSRVRRRWGSQYFAAHQPAAVLPGSQS